MELCRKKDEVRVDRVHIAVFLAIAALAWWITLVLQGTAVTSEHAAPFTVVMSALGVLGYVFEHFLWRCQLLHGWFFTRPNLRGTWRVELRSSHMKQDSGEGAPLIVCYMGVEQTLSELKMHLMTSESESWCIASHTKPSPSGNGYQVVCVYSSKPNIHLRDERISEIHNGAIILDTHGAGVRPDTLTAEYWTDRKTTGTMNFTSRVDRVFTRFEDANQHFGARTGLP